MTRILLTLVFWSEYLLNCCNPLFLHEPEFWRNCKETGMSFILFFSSEILDLYSKIRSFVRVSSNVFPKDDYLDCNHSVLTWMHALWRIVQDLYFLRTISLLYSCEFETVSRPSFLSCFSGELIGGFLPAWPLLQTRDMLIFWANWHSTFSDFTLRMKYYEFFGSHRTITCVFFETAFHKTSLDCGHSVVIRKSAICETYEEAGMSPSVTFITF